MPFDNRVDSDGSLLVQQGLFDSNFYVIYAKALRAQRQQLNETCRRRCSYLSLKMALRKLL